MSTNSKMVVVWGENDVLNTSIQILLAKKEDLQVVNVSSERELTTLLLSSDKTNQNIVVVHQKNQNGEGCKPLKLLKEYPHIKVIQISLENNSIDVYSKQEVLIKQPIDLINEI